MDGHIAHLHCHYQYLGNRGDSVSIASRLDRLAENELSTVYENALDQALGDDPTVYILNRVRARTLLKLGQDTTDSDLTKHWGYTLAGAVIRSIFEEDHGNLIRFTNQPEYTASFIVDLLQGRAWDCWYYGTFSHLKSLSTNKAVYQVMLENCHDLPTILATLQSKNVVTTVTDLLPEQSLSELWSKGLDGYQPSDNEEFRPLFIAAIQLINRLDLWLNSPPANEIYFQSYTGSKLPEIDWQDTVSLASIVIHIIRFFFDRNYLRPLYEAPDTIFIKRLDEVLDELDWLDRVWLREALITLLAGKEAVKTDLPTRKYRAGLTPRQRELLEDLIAVLRTGQIKFDHKRTNSTANAVRWYAALIAYAPHWSEGRLATDMIKRLLQAWSQLANIADQLEQPDKNAFLSTLPPHERYDALESLKFLSRLGKPGVSIIETLSDVSDQEATAGTIIETDCAGVFLLLRVILDLRLPQLVANTEYPATTSQDRLGVLLTSLGMFWSGASCIRAGQIDAGLNLLAGVDSTLTPESLKTIWSNTSVQDHARFQEALLTMLAGQRILQGDTLHLYSVQGRDGKTILIAGDATGRLWPLGRCLQTKKEAPGVLKEWLQCWEEATGINPSIVCEKKVEKLLCGSIAENLLIIPKATDIAATDDAMSKTYWSGREALLDALGTLQKGKIDLPNVDLTLSLIASTLLRVWARWLRRFSDSGITYLLEGFINRSGQIFIEKDRIIVNMESRALDVIIEMAGYTADLAPIAWLGNRRINFRLGD